MMYKFWSNPQPDSLARRESPAVESTFAARQQHCCTAIGVSAPHASRAACSCPHSDRQYYRHRVNLLADQTRRDGAIPKLTRCVTAPNPRRMGTRSCCSAGRAALWASSSTTCTFWT